MSVQGSSAHPSGSTSERVGVHNHENAQSHRPTSSIYGKPLDVTSLGLAASDTLVTPSHSSLNTQPRAIGPVDIAAFAAQAAHAAHADHAAALLRRKQATATLPTSTTACSGTQQGKDSINRPPPGECVAAPNGSPSSSGGSAGTAGAAYCLIPQPFHQNNQVKRHITDGCGSSDNVRSEGGGVAALHVGGVPPSASFCGSQSVPGSGGGGADGGFGGGGQAKSNTDGSMKRKAKELDEQGDVVSGDRSVAMSAECRLERSREQNRQSSRKARLRRKSEEISLKEQIQGIQVRLALSQPRDPNSPSLFL